MMQGLHHQQQQLAALLSAALPKDDKSPAASSSSSSSKPSDVDDSSRLGAINSLHRAIVFPHNSVLVTHSASFLAQGFSQLLSDRSYPVRQAAVTAYGALCAVLCSISISTNGRQNHVLLGNLVDRFIGWALPLQSKVTAGDGTMELALEGLREFLSIGDIGATDRYALPILKGCQELLEDERTSLSLLPQLLGVLTLISLKFFLCFQPHFVDIVDLLLGWAMIPDLAESDRRVIIDSFLQFQKHWVNNLQFSLGLLSKFLGDMDVLLQDGSTGTPQQCQRLLALLSCFSTVLQSTASGLLEINLLEEIREPLSKMLPRLLGCLSVVRRKFGWSKWMGDSWRCLTLLAEILCERFSSFYPLAIDILFQSLEMEKTTGLVGACNITSFQVHGVLKTNLQLLSLQKLGLLPSTVHKLLQFDTPISQLRLHPNHLVTASSAATYVFLLQHGNSEVVEQVLTLLMEELELLKSMLGKNSCIIDSFEHNLAPDRFSKSELLAIIRFDLKVLLSCVSLGGGSSLIGQAEVDTLYANRSEKMISYILKRLNPFNLPIQGNVELQATVFKTLDRLSTIEFLSKSSLRKQINGKVPLKGENDKQSQDVNTRDDLSSLIFEHLKKYIVILVKALHVSSSLAVKVAALHWIHTLCKDVLHIYDTSTTTSYPCEAVGCADVLGHLVFSVLDAASDEEPKVRSQVASVVEMLLQAKLIHHTHLHSVTEMILEKLGDPEKDIKDSFVRLLSHALPITVFVCGICDNGILTKCKPNVHGLGNRSKLQWKQFFALKQLPQQLHSQQLVSILSYISQRWKVPISSWIQRLVHTCRRSKDFTFTQLEETGNVDVNGLWWDINVEEDLLGRTSSVNLLAGAWWAIHEAARYCITTRLRTNLGGPSQTFAALERMLLDIVHVLQVDTEPSDGSLNIVGSSYARLLPLRLLLDFVEALKKNVYNAYDGSIVLPSASRQSSLFFRANKKVCEEWFLRICEPMMNAGLALQCHDATIEYCSLRLQELKSLVASSLKDRTRAQVTENLPNLKGKFAKDILRVLRHMALALCKNREPQALVGLQKWVTMAFSPLFMEENQSPSDSGLLGPFSWITGLVYQANGQYEKAAAHFTHLLQTEELLGSVGSDGVQFAIARIVESYTAVSDWKSLESWLSELQTLRSKHAGKSYSGALTMAGSEINAIHALARFDEGDFMAAWACLDLTPKSSSELTLDPKIALQRSEQMLLQAMLFKNEGKVDKVQHETQKAKLMLEETLSILPLDGLAEAAVYVNQLHCIFAFEESCKLISTEGKQVQSLLSSYIQAVQSPISGVHQDCSLWLKVLRVYQTIDPTSSVTLTLYRNLLNLARKQRNLMLADRLNDYLKNHLVSYSEGGYHDSLMSSLQYESILLMHAENRIEEAYTTLWSFVRPCMLSSSSSCAVSNTDDSILKAKACLKLTDWLRKDSMDLGFENFILKMLPDVKVTDSFPGRQEARISGDNLSSISRLDPIVEELVGTATKVASRLCPTMGKSWISYASWCYRQARASLSGPNEIVLQSCSFSPILVSEILPDRFKLSQEELLSVREFVVSMFRQKASDPKDSYKALAENDVPLEASEHMRNEDYVNAVVQQVVNIIEAAAGAPGAENSTAECLSATVSSQLQNFFQFANVGMEGTVSMCLDGLIDVWWSLRKRRVSLFGHAAQAFISYLSYSSSKHWGSPLAGADGEESQKTVSYTLRATLHVLHILLNFGVELKDTLEPALSAVPLLPWQDVIPQLFARLSSHPDQAVRKQLEGLLIMLAKLSPSSIVYPTLADMNASEEEPSEELQHILACLTKLYPSLVLDVQLMIKELENVTILWEELWLSTLQDLHPDVMRRINLLKEEATRIAENVTLSHSEKIKINGAKYSAMMAPIVVALERRLASTSRKPETLHEMWFHEEYMEHIKSAILNFKVPPASTIALGEVWKPFDHIAASLASYQRKSSISLGEVAPQLALLSSSDVPMPGLEKQNTVSESEGGLTSTLQGIVTIAAFSGQLFILSTKTKPKKLVILGSDGQKYPYLLKGREDLRLDARIMQLLQAVNGFLQSSSATRGEFLGIRYYLVTPISGRAGLIQWVDNVTSIYSVFKSWQNRVQVAQLSASAAGNTKNSVPPPVPRPIDMFYGKIIPALKEKGIRRVISRRDWPLEVKRKVLLDLMNEVPRQLLQQELWCASEGFKAFNSKLKRYSGSVAAMSMVGHILGLGDRHLDNILMDFQSGDIVHIDYNVCFDKGQRLKVPEIVPFRLTQTIEGALGLTGIEGSFRANCEAVLGVLKKNKDILLMLLEVFVWDPLVEWTRGDFHDDAAIVGEERKGMELAVSLSLFASRVQEIRVPLQEHHDLLLATLPAVESALQRFVDVLNQYEIVSAVYYRADQERSNLILHETSAKSIVAEATGNSEKARTSFELQAREFAQAKAVIAEKAQEAATWIEQHGRILDALRSSSIPEIKSRLKLSGREEGYSLASAVLVAGVPFTIVPEPTQVQCYDIDREVSQLISELDNGLSSAVTALQSYSSALQRILPLNYLTTSPVHSWGQVLQLLMNTISLDILSLSRRQAADLLAKVRVDGFDRVSNIYDDLCLQVEKYAEQIEKVEAEYQELVNSIGSDTESKAKERLFSSFMNFMQSTGLEIKDSLPPNLRLLKHEMIRDSRSRGELEEKQEKTRTVLNVAVISLYTEMKHIVLDMLNHSTGRRIADNRLQSDLVSVFEEQIEKCVLVAGWFNELQQYFRTDISHVDTSQDGSDHTSPRNWASIFKSSLLSCKNLVGQMIEGIIPNVIRSVISFDSEVMDAFGSLSQIRGSIDTALEQLIEVQMERASLAELEQSYFVKVGVITEQQLALEEAAVKGREHLSWEEAEELASQEEACRAQLDKLHQTWNQKDARTSSLIKREASIRSALASAEHHFQSLISEEQDKEPHSSRSNSLLLALVQPFTKLESLNKMMSSLGEHTDSSTGNFPVTNSINSSVAAFEHRWKFSGTLKSHSFFIWKVAVMDSFLDSCIRIAASSRDHNLGFDQLVNIVKKKLAAQLQEHIGQYMREQVTPMLLTALDTENERLKQMIITVKEASVEELTRDFGSVKRVKQMLEEYCNAHETVRAGISAASIMKRQVNELKEALHKTCLDIVQMEWMHDVTSSPLNNCRLICHKFLASDDSILPVILNLSRPRLLEILQSSVAKVSRSLEGLKGCEQTSVTAEGQLERAMGWACGGPSSGTIGGLSAKNTGIPPEFHDHLMRRRQLLGEAREKASDIIKVCMSILEFEASRDGIFGASRELYSVRTGTDGRSWQQIYLNALTRLDATYHSFAHAEQEWQLAQSNMEAASNGLLFASNELSAASAKAKSASGDLQITFAAMRDCACEASMAVSSFGRITRSHSALTSECGSMLEEVLAITEGLHDVHSSGKEAAALHSSLMEDLSKANSILLPLESVLSKDVAAMTDAMSTERDTQKEISPIHGQAIYHSYHLKITEACQAFKPLVPSLLFSVKGLHSMLTRLARAAYLHAGNLHKALEGLGESEEVRSEDINLSRQELVGDDTEYENKENDIFSNDQENNEDFLGTSELVLQDKGWISPPGSIYDSSSDSGVASAEASVTDSFTGSEVTEQHFTGSEVTLEQPHVPNSKDNKDFVDCVSSSGSVQEVALQGEAGSKYTDGSQTIDGSDDHLKAVASQSDKAVSSLPEINGEVTSLNQDKGEEKNWKAPLPNVDAASRITRGKNVYAMSVLRRVEMKLEGRDIADNREISIAEQVDYLLKQATSVDNLCNMYEGWTPWI